MPQEFEDTNNDDSMMGPGGPGGGDMPSNPGLPPPIDRPPPMSPAPVGGPPPQSPPPVMTTMAPRPVSRWEARRQAWIRNNRYQPPAVQPGTDPRDMSHMSRFHPPQGDPNRMGRPGTREAMWRRGHWGGPWHAGHSRWRPFQSRYGRFYDSRHHSYRDGRYRPGMVRWVHDKRVKGGNSGFYQILGGTWRYDNRPRGAVVIKGRDGRRYYAVRFRRGDHGFGRHHGFGGGHGYHGGRGYGGGRGGWGPPQWDRGGWGRGGRGRDRDRDRDWDDDDDRHGRRRRRRRRKHGRGRHDRYGRGGRGRGWGPPPWARGGFGRPPMRPPFGGGRVGGGPISWMPPAGYV